MAYVAISGQLVERVQNNIRIMFNKEMESLGEFKGKITGNEAFVTNAIWGNNLHLQSQMPQEWLGVTNEFKVEIVAADSTRGNKTHIFRFSNNVSVPPCHSDYETYVITLDEPIIQAASDHYNQAEEIQLRWRKVRSDITEFLGKCKSLNEAVKLWPDVAMYIHHADIERMGVKREKARESEALAALSQLDTDMLVGAVVISRMSQAAA